MKHSNAARLIATLGIAGVMAFGSLNAPMAALADEQDSQSAQDTSGLVTAVTRDLPGQLMGKVNQITEQQCSMESLLAAGSAVDADAYRATLPDSVSWKSCGVSTYGLGDGLMGSNCSDGSKVTATSMGVAHKTLPLGTSIQISYNGKVVNATVRDRGPFVAGRDIDLQPAVASALGFSGVGKVEYRVL